MSGLNPRSGGSNSSAGVDDVNAAWRVMRNPVSDVAEQVATHTADPPIADHQQVRIQLLGYCEEGVRRIPQASDRLDGNPRLLESLPHTADDLFGSPQHEYTRDLLAAAPEPASKSPGTSRAAGLE